MCGVAPTCIELRESGDLVDLVTTTYIKQMTRYCNNDGVKQSVSEVDWF
jgi:hypothetical protein